MKSFQLLFIYNADAGLFASLIDFVHKIVSPYTYNCSLCKLTYGSMAMKQQWKNFLETIPAHKTFLHKNEFEKQYQLSFDLPAIFYLREGKPTVLLSAADISSCSTLDDLQNALLSQLKTVPHISE